MMDEELLVALPASDLELSQNRATAEDEEPE